MSYTIKLPQFEGPFDLLLFFIERDELDIYNIPIATISNDFLEYIQEMERLNIDLASEFILVAATLMRIKVKMLIPRKEVDEEGNEIDPREELVQRLLEYKRYKSVLDELKVLEDYRAKKEPRGNMLKELKNLATKALVDAELESLTLFKILKAFEKVMQRYDNASRVVVHTVVKYEYTVREQKTYLLGLVRGSEKTDFETLFMNADNRVHAIVTFLAMLELLSIEEINMVQGLGFNNFYLTQ